jgi:hypothetical protein
MGDHVMGQTPLTASWLFRAAPTTPPRASARPQVDHTPRPPSMRSFVPAAPSFNGSNAFAGRSARVDFDNADRRQSSAIAEPRHRAVPAQTDLS